MQKINRYVLLTADNAGTLTKLVIEAIEKGYQPFGSAGVATTTDSNENESYSFVTFTQAVVRYSEEVAK